MESISLEAARTIKIQTLKADFTFRSASLITDGTGISSNILSLIDLAALNI